MNASHHRPRRLRLSTTLAALCAASLLSLTPSQAEAFCRSTTCSGNCPLNQDGCKSEGAPLYWTTLCIGISVQQDGTQWIPQEEVVPVINASFAEWSDRECAGGGMSTIAFQDLGQISCHTAEYNVDGPNANVILFQDNRWVYSGQDNTLAKTTVSFDTDTGEIFDADIEVNHANNGFTLTDSLDDCSSPNDCYDLRSVLTHEVGHFIGLDHTQAPEGTMNASYTRSTIELRTLEDDDVAAVCAAYPPGRDARCNTKPRNGFSEVCAADEDSDCGCRTVGKQGRHSQGWLLTMALALAGLYRRRSARS